MSSGTLGVLIESKSKLVRSSFEGVFAAGEAFGVLRRWRFNGGPALLGVWALLLVLALGVLALGVFALGVAALGVAAFCGVLAFGVTALGVFALGVAALGVAAFCGVLVLGETVFGEAAFCGVFALGVIFGDFGALFLTPGVFRSWATPSKFVVSGFPKQKEIKSLQSR